MRVSRIEIFGFKSFMDRTVLPLEGGLTGIVGPNGCGKSNIVDAIRWVLGETRAKSLRGANFEDVIFNGTDKLRPLGLAEVTITVKAKQDSFFDEMLPSLLNDDIAQSLSSIDKAQNELEKKEKSNVINFKDLGKDKEKLEIITTDIEDIKESDIATLMMDSNIENINNEDIAKIVEKFESSQINTLKNENQNSDVKEINKKEKKETKKENVEDMALLSRFSWLKATREVQVTRRLYRSGESEYFINRVPCRLKDLKELFRAIGIGARAYTIVAQNEVTRIITAKPEEKRQMIEEAAGVTGFKDKISCANKRLEDTKINVSRLEDIITEVTRNVNSLKRQSNRARDRKGLLDRIKEIDLTLLRDSYGKNANLKTKFEEDKKEATKLQVVAKNEMDVVKVKEETLRLNMAESDAKADDLRLRIDSIKDELNEKDKSLIKLRSLLQEKKVRCESLDIENNRLKERKATLLQRQEEEKKEIQSLEGEKEKLKDELKSIENIGEENLKRASSNLEETKLALNEKEREYKKVHESFLSTKIRLESIDEQLISASPVTQLKKTLGNQNLSSEFLSNAKNAKLFIDGISVSSKYAKALQAILGEKAEFLISNNPSSLIQSFVKMAKETNKKGLGVGIFKEGESVINKSNTSVNINFKSMLDLINVKKEYELSVNNILKDVYVCETLDEGIEFFNKNNSNDINDIVLVTLDGEILTNYSFYSLKHEGGVVQLKAKKEEYEKEFNDLQAKEANINREKNVLIEKEKEAQVNYKQELDNFRKRQEKIREVSNNLSNIIGKLEAKKRLFSQENVDLDNLNSQFKDIENKKNTFLNEISNIENQILEASSFDESTLKETLSKLNEEYKLANENRNQKRQELSTFNEELDVARKKYEDFLREVNKIEIDLQKSKFEIENIEKIVLEKYEKSDLDFVMSFDESEALEDDTRLELKGELEKIKARIFREGEVDPTSIERYEEEKVRLEELEKQKRDLESAMSVLNKAITRLVDTSQERFMSVFLKVKENFSTIAPRLFGGGFADLVLSDESKPLESGIDIIARPPGKKLKSLELLSGGEKTLCAISLILATFLERPSPLCILDEVDAPLDEANLMRFLSIMKDLSKKTQVVLITHNKQSMIASNSLIGVTMQEPGATTLLSVSLEDVI